MHCAIPATSISPICRDVVCYEYVRPEARHRNDLLLERGKAPELARLYEYSCQDSGVVV